MNYYGPFEIQSIEETEHTTPKGDPIKKVDLGDVVKYIPQKVIDLVATEEKKDYDHISEAKNTATSQAMLEAAMEFDVEGQDVNQLMHKTSQAIQNNINKALSYEWFGSLYAYAPGANPHYWLGLNESIIKLREYEPESQSENKQETSKEQTGT